MTGFGRGEASAGPFTASVEVRSVNHRFADVRVKVPSGLAGLEPVLQQRVQGRVHRGRLDVSVSVARAAGETPPLEINRDLVAAYVKAADTIRRDFGLTGEVTLQTVLALPDALSQRAAAAAPSGEEKEAVLAALDQAMTAHDAMRSEEGAILARDLRRRLESIGRLQRSLSERAPQMIPFYAKKLETRVRELAGPVGAAVDPARLAQEIALTAERSDITEELVRLAGYLEQVDRLLAQAGEPVGKKLDFIMQEMNREANTINSKAIDLSMCQDAIDVKAEVEKIREQVQNLE